MARARMVVVAGPPGSGKTTYFPVTALRVDSFNAPAATNLFNGYKSRQSGTPDSVAAKRREKASLGGKQARPINVAMTPTENAPARLRRVSTVDARVDVLRVPVKGPLFYVAGEIELAPAPGTQPRSPHRSDTRNTARRPAQP
jgi:hypothetical protein